MRNRRTAISLAFCMLLAYSAPAAEKNYDTFAQCLAKKGAVMYGAWWCPHCKEQKEKFGESFAYINYVECGTQDIPLDRSKQTEACKAKDIHRYPTWIFTTDKGEERVEKILSMEELAEKTGCKVP
jgi:thiol-disulfide isomerase/thioredoxin